MKFLVSCPNCGRQLFNSKSICDVEIKCSKCRKFLEVESDGETLKVKEIKINYDASK